MRTSNTRGFTLIELLIALVMLAIVGGAMLSVMTNIQRVTRRQTEVVNMQGSLRSGYQLVQAELVELATNSTPWASDLVTIGPQALTYRAMRGVGESCEFTQPAVKIRKSSYEGLRAPVAARDGLLLYLEGDSTTTADDTWVDELFTAVTNSTCPDGAEAWSLVVTLLPSQVAAAGVPGPLRTYEIMELGLYNDGTRNWLGIRSVSAGEAVLEPVVGPLDANGVAFQYFDAAGAQTANPSEVTSILLSLRGVTDRSVGTGFGANPASPTDTLNLRIQLRNAR